MADPGLTDGAVLLRQWRPTDADRYAATAHDAEIQRYTTESPTLTAAEVRAPIVALADQTDTVGLVICDATTGQRLGNIALRFDASVGEVSYWVAASAQGRGVATRALRLLSAWALLPLGCRRCGCGPTPTTWPLAWSPNAPAIDAHQATTSSAPSRAGSGTPSAIFRGAVDQARQQPLAMP
jgi:RimJ/RimL family protein N-acetyltransferase